jgi:hypothetical protein
VATYRNHLTNRPTDCSHDLPEQGLRNPRAERTVGQEIPIYSGRLLAEEHAIMRQSARAGWDANTRRAQSSRRENGNGDKVVAPLVARILGDDLRWPGLMRVARSTRRGHEPDLASERLWHAASLALEESLGGSPPDLAPRFVLSLLLRGDGGAKLLLHSLVLPSRVPEHEGVVKNSAAVHICMFADEAVDGFEQFWSDRNAHLHTAWP